MKITEEDARALLERYAPSHEALTHVMEHCLRVRDKALSLVEGKNHLKVDIELLKTGSILHDIGRFRYPPGSKNSILHGIEGEKILLKEGLPLHARIARTHIGVGITKEDILKQGLPLPLDDYVPCTLEEILIAYADNLDSPGISCEKDVEERFAQEVGEDYRIRVRKFHHLVHQILGDNA